jgi:hypothetical protein
MTEYRHHRAGSNGPVVVFVEVPVAGSNKTLREVKPLPFQRNPPTHWRPATRPPSKAAASVRLLDSFMRQDQIVREMLKPLI